ncbi:MAG: anticodon-binding protein [Nostocales cyanobacterium]|nr:MAG: anticodon-binding protein [Nostocales cyanobacterium]TAF04129.1 MAG: anticodon-binding protein [Nostocales cyanobacterium]
MHHWLLFQKYTSIKHLVYIQLRNFLSVYTKDEAILLIKNGRVPLYQDTDVRKILYISSVALQLSGGDSSKSTSLVRDIASGLSADFSELFSVKVVAPAWIHIELTDPTLAAWLNFLIDKNGYFQEFSSRNQVTNINITEFEPQESGLKNINSYFQIQYAHARCCSLLRLAGREGLMKIVQEGTNNLRILSHETIPWLNCDQKLRFYQPEELCLLGLLVKTVDNLVFPDAHGMVNWKTEALKLSAAWESFWCSCRIWGDVKNNSLELAQARLGLLMVTQLVLKSVLENRLGVLAPMEL